ncbi:MAG TPA: hypothetical protein VHB77_07665, partial [Planctomycetaceae bacterium]|nr:hypothetical protein [Planctomycetaceae bacterium]
MPSTLRRSFWIPRPLVALLVLLVVVSTALGAWTYAYAQKRLAAIAYVKSNRGSVTFAASPGWWPEKVPLPEWFKPVASVYPGNKRPCDM